MTQIPAHPPKPTRPRVLLVEDDRATYTALRGILTLRGWDVVVATTLAEARPVLGGNALSAVILDLMLPDGNGEEILDELRAANGNIPVAVTTGVSDAARLAAVHKKNPTALLQKPIVLAQLLKAIAAA